MVHISLQNSPEMLAVW